MPKIALDTLKRIIREEMAILHEGEDHDAAAKIMNSATKLLGAIELFKDSSSEKVKGTESLESDLENVTQVLSRIISSPMTYVDTTSPGMKKVSLKPNKSSDLL